MRRARRLLLCAPLLVAGALLAGSLGLFLARASAAGRAIPRRADGIVALTGGADRVATALRLLAAGRGRILLISGVGGAAAFSDLARQSGADPALASRVTLGREAASTYGNAQETAAWARAHQVASLIVVTAWYHMPRALAELSRALPGVALLPVAVQPGGLGPADSWRLLAGEYPKWLAAEAGLSGLAAHAEPPAGVRQTDIRQTDIRQTDSRAHAVRAGG